MLKTISGRGYRLLGSWGVQPRSTWSEAGSLEKESARPFQTNLPEATSELIGRDVAG
jgi:hypothetical protein